MPLIEKEKEIYIYIYSIGHYRKTCVYYLSAFDVVVL